MVGVALFGDVEVFSVLRMMLGFAFFFASGWFACNALFKKTELDTIEKITLSTAFALILPAALVLLLGLGLGIKLNDLTMYGVYLLVIAASIAYRKFDLNAFSLN